MHSTLERLNERRQRDEGFTLIELLVVIVILGILAGVVVFAVGGITDRGEESACEATSKAVEVASESFIAQSPTGAPAGSLGALETADLLRIDDDMTVAGNTLQTSGGDVVYAPSDGGVTDTCA